MTPLRQTMITTMRMRGLADQTQRSYLHAVTSLARYTHQSPDQLTPAEVNRYFQYLVIERQLAPETCRVQYHGIRFLFMEVLGWSRTDLAITLPKCPQRIPHLLSRTEVSRIISASTNMIQKTMFILCYGCGLRVSELVRVKVGDIDGEQRLLRINQSKGAKDRLLPLPNALLIQLRSYWQRYRPREWLFPRRHSNQPRSDSYAQQGYTKAKRAAGITKVGGIHALRHAFATHSLESGVPVHRLQQLMGHRNLRSTLTYIHWIPLDQLEKSHCDLIGQLNADQDEERGHE